MDPLNDPTEPPPAPQPVVLVVDDEAIVRLVAKKILESRGMRVLTAPDGKEAVDLFRNYSEEVAVVLLDVVMPVMDGGRAMEELLKIRNSVKVVLSSGLTEQQAKDKCPHGGHSDFLKKPYRAETLIEVIGAHL